MPRSFDIIDSLGGHDPAENVDEFLKQHNHSHRIPRFGGKKEPAVQRGMTDERLIAMPSNPVWKRAVAAAEAVAAPSPEVAFEQTT